MNMIVKSNPIDAAGQTVSTANPFGWLQRSEGKRFSEMDGLVEFLTKRSEIAHTELCNNNEIELLVNPNPETKDDLNMLGIRVGDHALGMTHWSFGQLAQLTKAPANYLRSLPATIVKDCVEYGLRFNREVEQIKPYFDGNELRAITGPGYGRIDDYEVVEAVQTILDDGRWVPAEKHMGLRVTDRSLQMFLIDQAHPVVVGKAPNGSDDVMYRGIRIANSELGYSSLSVESFLFRSYCLNGCIFGMNEASRITVRHSKNAPFRWAREVEPAIKSYADEDGSRLIEHVEKAKEAQVAKDDDAAVKFLNNRGLSRSQARQAIERVNEEENRDARTVWDMVQGITAIARDVKAVEDRADLERVAGNIWQKVAA